MARRLIDGRMQEVPDRNTAAVLRRLHPEPEAAPLTPDEVLPHEPLLTDTDVDLLIEALGHLAGSQADRGLDYRPAAHLQAKLMVNKRTLTRVAAGLMPAATMVPQPCHDGEFTDE